jgi:hypothetical protein
MLLESVYEAIPGYYLYGVEICKRLAAEELLLLRGTAAAPIPSDNSAIQNADGAEEAAGAYSIILSLFSIVFHAVVQ